MNSKAACRYPIATHWMPPLGGPGNPHLRCACITGRSSDSRTFRPWAEFLLTVASQSFVISADYGVRFRSPLRGSSGFEPDSLLSACYARQQRKVAYDGFFDDVNTIYCGYCGNRDRSWNWILLVQFRRAGQRSNQFANAVRDAKRLCDSGRID